MNHDIQPADRRVQRTRQSLRVALISLLVERGWDDINIQDLCKRADVGRSTFYMHFENKEQLLVSGLNELRIALREHAAAPQNFNICSLPFVRGLIAHAYEQRILFRSIIGKRSGHVVHKYFREMVLQLVEEDIAQLADPGWKRDAGARYISGALVELLAWWVDAGNGQTAEEIESHFHRLTLPVIKELLMRHGKS